MKPPDADGRSLRMPSTGSRPRARTGPAGEDARKAIDELIKGQRQTAGSIPGELEELVRMVPQ